MKNRLLILISVLVIVLLGGGIWFFMNQDKLTGSADNENAVTNTNLPTTNSTSTPTNLSLPNEQKGDIPLDARGTVGGIELHFSSLAKVETFEGDPAGKDKQYIIVYFDGVQSAQVLPVKRAIDAGEIILLSNGGAGTLATTKVASQAFKNDRGYVKFAISKTAGQLRLMVGPAGSPQEIKLP